MVLSAYLRLLIFLPAILIPACASSSPAFLMMDPAYTNKASGGDGISVELFQILKDDAVKVLHLICQQIWKTQHWPQD